MGGCGIFRRKLGSHGVRWIMIVREGSKSDIEQVSRLWLQMIVELSPSLTPNVEWWKEIANNLFNAGIYYLIVAEEEGILKGFIDGMLFPEPSTGRVHGVGQHMYVRPNYRKAIVAPRLYRKLIKVLRNNGATVLELFCFNNERAFWEKKGYRPLRQLMRREVKCLTQ